MITAKKYDTKRKKKERKENEKERKRKNERKEKNVHIEKKKKNQEKTRNIKNMFIPLKKIYNTEGVNGHMIGCQYFQRLEFPWC